MKIKDKIYTILIISGIILFFGSLGSIDIGKISILQGLFQILSSVCMVGIGLFGKTLEYNRRTK